MENLKKQRLKKLIKIYGLVLIIGLAYALFIMFTGLKIPCIFNLIFNIYCPGCGISRMCISLLKLDFFAAFKYNMLCFCLLPIGLIYLINKSVIYIKTGEFKEGKITKVVYIILFVLSVIFCVLRNINGFEFLAPIV